LEAAAGTSLFERAIMAAENVRSQLDPDEDWEPTILTWSGIYLVGGVDEAVGAGRDAAEVVAEAIRRCARGMDELALILTVWMVDHRRDSPEGRLIEQGGFDDVPKPCDDPRRLERVMVYGLRRGEAVRTAYAPITRRQRRSPLLGPWQRAGGAGRIASAMLAVVNRG
jgi:hypothetical protein